MSDISVTTEAPQSTTTEAPLMNTEQARQPDGTIKDQSTQTQKTDSSDTTGSSETKDKAPVEGEKKPEAQTGAPEKYEDFKAPEGYQLNKDLIEAALPVFKKLNLTQEAAQELVNFQAELQKKQADAPQREFETTTKAWRNEVLNDSKLGNNGDLRPEVKQNISAFLGAIGDTKVAESFKQAMDVTGVGNHPAFIRALNTIGATFKEGTAVKGAGPSAEGQKAPDAKPKSIANAMYPNLS